MQLASCSCDAAFLYPSTVSRIQVAPPSLPSVSAASGPRERGPGTKAELFPKRSGRLAVLDGFLLWSATRPRDSDPRQSSLYRHERSILIINVDGVYVLPIQETALLRG